jgi:PAS domain S-box
MVDAEKPEDYTLVNLVRVLIAVSMLFLSFFLGSSGWSPLAFIALGALVFSLAWLFLEKTKIIYTPRTPWLVYIPTTFDVLAVTVFITVTGSAHSVFVIGYYFIILVSSMNFREHHGIYAAALSFCAFAGANALVDTRALPMINLLGEDDSPSLMSRLLAVAGNGFVFIAINRLARFQIAQTSSLILRLQKSETQLNQQNEVVKLLLHDFEAHASDWLFQLDEDLRLTYLPERLLAFFQGEGLTERRLPEILGRLMPDPSPEDGALIAGLYRILEGGRPFRGAQIRLSSGGQERWLEFDATPITAEVKGKGGWRGVGRDITERKLLEQQLQRRATQDERTGLPNRYGFYDILDRALESDSLDGKGVLGIVKVDNLFLIRSNGGTAFANAALESFVRTMREFLGASFLLARLEYDEFAFWAEGASLDIVESIHHANRILRKPLTMGSESVLLEVRTGIAFFPEDGDSRQALLRAADLALISAHSFSRRSLTRYNAELSDRYLRKMEMSKISPEALELGQFHVVYQPQVRASDSALIGAEALVRWQHPAMGMISPAEFIPIAEQSGFISVLDEWVMLESCRIAATWELPISVSVNVSGIQLQTPIRLINSIENAIAQSGLPPQRLIVEITESSLLTPGVEARDFFAAMKTRGVQIALDDFGTGYSSLAYIQELPIDELKIDQAFVRKLKESDNSEKIVQAIINLSSELGFTTVAEGVETQEQAEALAKMGCTVFQGYLYGKPLQQADMLKRCQAT